jgi:hypothetical protein
VIDTTGFPKISWRQVKTLLEWEWSRELGRGWSLLLWILFYAGLAGVVLYVDGTEIARDFSRQFSVVLPVIVAVELHRPFLYVGRLFVSGEKIPRKFRSAPVAPSAFAGVGVSTRLVKAILRLTVFLGLVSLGSFSLSFLVTPSFWILWLCSVPMAVGWGLLFGAIRLSTGTADDPYRLGELFLMVLGVLVAPGTLPFGLGGLSFLSPYYYPLNGTTVFQDLHGSLVPLLYQVPVSLLLGGLLIAGVGWLFVRTIRRALTAGRFHQVS